MITSSLVFLSLAFVLIFLLRVFKIGPIIGFLAAGLAVGPHGFGLFNLGPSFEFLGDIAMMFLWFGIGLELNIKRLWQMRKTIFGFGAAQVMMVVIMLFPILFGLTNWTILGTMMVALILAMSSTSADLQILADRNELQTPMGRQTFSILLFQDLLAIPILAMLPVFAGKSFNLGAEVIDILVLTIGLVFGVVIVGRFIINPILRRLAKMKSKEVFLLAIILNIILWAAAMDYVGLPWSMGAFLAGMILSETMFRHQIQTDISPYQIMFLALFLTVLGLSLDVPMLIENWMLIVLASVALVFIKFTAIYIVARVRNVAPRESFMIGLILAGCGEFGLLVLQTLRMGDISVVPYFDAEIMMAIIIISMILSPVLISIYDMLYKSGKLFSDSRAKKINSVQESEKVSVIICGFGRVGQTVATMLQAENIPYAAIDMNIDQVVHGRDAGFNVFYGDTTSDALLRQIGLAPRKTRAVIIALDNAAIAKRTVRSAKRVSPGVRIFARARNMDEAEILITEGVKIALPETVESSFMLGHQVLESLGVPNEDIDILMSQLRDNNYARLTDVLKSDKK